MPVLEAASILVLALFILWLFSPPKGGGHRPPKSNLSPPTKPPPKPPDAWRK